MIDIQGYEGLYAATEDGKIWSYKREIFLKPSSDNSGYLHVNLCKDGKVKNYTIHKLIAETFLSNPNNLPDINHKDEDKTNNHISNLEWVSHKDNLNYGTRNYKIAKANGKMVYCVELDKTFISTTEAGNFINKHKDGIARCCRGQQKTCGGYHWQYITV